MTEYIEKTNRTIGENIKRIRLKNGISQQEMANIIGVRQQRFSCIENGTGRIYAFQLFKLAQKLKLNVKEFFKEGKNDL